MSKKYYFYRRTIRPDDYEVYLHGSGIVGYSEEKKNKSLYFKGTQRELKEYMKNSKIPRRIESKNTLIGY